MRPVQLKAFHYVAIEGGFSRAAKALNLTQPAISDQVRRLEEHYDVLLFNRHRRQVQLTEIGERLLEITRRLFEIESQAQELLTESRTMRGGVLRIIADSPHHLLHVLGPFREKYPGVEILLRSGNTEEVVAALYNYEADVGVLGEKPQSSEFETIQLGSTPIVGFAARGHALEKQAQISVAELANWPLVLREEGSKTRQSLIAAAKAKGIKLSPSISAEGREAVSEIVAAGGGVGVVSQAEFSNDPRLFMIKIADAQIYMDEALICLKERNGGKLVQAFMQMAANTDMHRD